MRIIQILPEMDSGELARSVLDLSHELVRLGHESIVISNGGELLSRLTLRGGQHFQLPLQKKPFWSSPLVGRLRRQLKELRADVVHARTPLSAWFAWRAWRGLPEGERPRLVTGLNGFHSKSLQAGVLARGERVTAVSQCVSDHFQKHYGKKLAQPPLVIPRGVNTREFDRSAPVSGHWQQRLLNGYPQLEGKNWLLMPAPLTPGMGHPAFLQMLAEVVREREDAFGLIVGEAPEGEIKYARKLEKMALDLGLSDKVLFLGGRRDMRELYASSQICYSLNESPQAYGLTANEALAMNCPVVAYEKSGAAELLQECFPGGLVEQGNQGALVSTSLKILERPQTIHFHGFSHEDAALQTLVLYRELCSADPLPG